MIVLINGTYGVGKSTVARSIQEKIPNVEILESDFYYSQMLNENPYSVGGGTTPQNNMTFLTRFKKVIFDQLDDINKITIVVMAITQDECKNEILEPLIEKSAEFYHFILTANHETILDRINNQDNREKMFATSFLEPNIKFLENNFQNVPRIKTDNKDISAVADEIIDIIGLKN